MTEALAPHRIHSHLAIGEHDRQIVKPAYVLKWTGLLSCQRPAGSLCRSPSYCPKRSNTNWKPHGGDLPRRALEALAVEGYRSGDLSAGQMAEMLGLSVWETEKFLKERDAYLHYSPEDLRRDMETQERPPLTMIIRVEFGQPAAGGAPRRDPATGHPLIKLLIEMGAPAT